jgi:hypothetical protein
LKEKKNNMSSKSYDVYIDSGINLKVPSTTDPDTPEGYAVLKDLATKKFIDMLVKNQIDFTHEPFDEDEE